MNDNVPICTFCAATVKPDVVFFGEDLPQKYFLHTNDFPKADLLIVMGTSLQVNLDICLKWLDSWLQTPNLAFQIEPFASLVNTVRSTVPRLLLNRHAVGPFQKVPLRRGDYVELGNLEDTVRRFAEMLGWSHEIEELMRSQEMGVSSSLMLVWIHFLCHMNRSRGEIGNSSCCADYGINFPTSSVYLRWWAALPRWWHKRLAGTQKIQNLSVVWRHP